MRLLLLLATAVALAHGGGQNLLELWSCGRRSRLPDFNSLGLAHRSKMVETVNYPNRGWGFDETVGGRHFCHEFCARFRARDGAEGRHVPILALVGRREQAVRRQRTDHQQRRPARRARRYTGSKAGVSVGQVLEFEVQFFERHGGKNVVLLWAPPGSGWVLLKGEAISPPPPPPPPNPPPPPPTTLRGYKVSSAGLPGRARLRLRQVLDQRRPDQRAEWPRAQRRRRRPVDLRRRRDATLRHVPLGVGGKGVLRVPRRDGRGAPELHRPRRGEG